MTTTALDLTHHYLLIAGTDLDRLDGGETFWSKLATDEAHRERVGGGWLVAEYPVTSDWGSWEMHPAADEVVHVTGGELAVVLERDGGHERLRVTRGNTVVVPAGVWHTIDVIEPGGTLNLTHGPGTEHRPR